MNYTLSHLLYLTSSRVHYIVTALMAMFNGFAPELVREDPNVLADRCFPITAPFSGSSPRLTFVSLQIKSSTSVQDATCCSRSASSHIPRCCYLDDRLLIILSWAGLLIECDPSIKSMILKYDEERHDYIVEDLDDENHLVIKESQLQNLKVRLDQDLDEKIMQLDESESE
ncbi:hypothetical protein N7475_000072 [Penicillium sp. IBT 31633x]|nr:hypothetical protein N7475_000072 [Penicillium sp. IBT 31633x]